MQMKQDRHELTIVKIGCMGVLLYYSAYFYIYLKFSIICNEKYINIDIKEPPSNILM